MSDASEQKTISLAQIDGRIAELERQRNEALTRAARIAGERDEAIEIARTFRAEVERLTEVLGRQSVPDAPNASSDDAAAAH
ncbi:hypothetical protein [Methylorubrum populi]